MAMADQIPNELGFLVDWLTRRGFRRTEQQISAEFGNRFTVLEREKCRVRLVRERGQWWVEVAAPDGHGWFDLDIWRSCLEGGEAPLEASTLREQISYLRRRLSKIKKAVDRNGTVSACLARQGALRTRRRLGLTGKGDGGRDTSVG